MAKKQKAEAAEGEGNGTVLNAPDNAGGLTIDGISYEVDDGQVTVAPEHVATALAHGYSVPTK